MKNIYYDYAKEIYSTDDPKVQQKHAVKARLFPYVYNNSVTSDIIQALKEEVQKTGGLLVSPQGGIIS